MKWVCSCAAAILGIALTAAPLQAATPRVRALPIPNIDPELVNRKGILVGYFDQDLVSVEVGRTDKQVLLPESRYKIDLLNVTDTEVFFSAEEDGLQIVRAISLGKNHAMREVFRREFTWSRVLVNSHGDVAIQESNDDADDFMVVHTHNRRTIRIKIPEYFDPLVLTDDSALIGIFSEWNDQTEASERHLLLFDYSKRKKIRTVESKPVNRSVHQIVSAAASGKIFGLAAPIDGDDVTESNALIVSKIPSKNVSVWSEIAENEELQGYWQGRFIVRGPYLDGIPRTSRLVKSGGAPSSLTCSGLNGLSLEFYGVFAPGDITLAEIRATDPLNSYRQETVVLVPAKSPIGSKVNGQWSCQLQ